MQLDEIAAGIEDHYREWATDHIGDLDVVTRNPQIARRMVNFVQEAAKHPGSLKGTPAEAVKNCMKLTALSNFRLGLLVGLLLWKKPEEGPEPPLLGEPQEKIASRCETCEGRCEVCLHCGETKDRCVCETGGYSVVECHACNGSGYTN